MRVLHYADVEAGLDNPERAGRLATVLREEGGEDPIVTDGGDTLAPGVLALSTKGKHALAFQDAVSPAVATFGNHDFDHGRTAAREVTWESPARYVTGNVMEGGQPFGDAAPWTIVDRADGALGVVGVTDPDASVPDSLAVEDPVRAVRTAVAELRDHGVRAVLVLAHAGDDVVRTLARQQGVDAIAAGHVHRVGRERISGTPIVRPGVNGEVVWELDFDGERVTTDDHDVERAVVDESVAEILQAERYRVGLEDTVGYLDEPLVRDRAKRLVGRERAGSLVATAYREGASADVGVLDTLAIREGPRLSGTVSRGDVVGLVPFAAPLCRIEVSGRTLSRLLRESVVTDDRAAGGPGAYACWLQVAGATLRVAGDGTVESVRVDGEPIDGSRNYVVGTNTYVLSSDEFPAVDRSHLLAQGEDQYEAVVALFEAGRVAGIPEGFVDSV
ncbi:bifunctional metallophosphatase/5'-nucleotidase [Halorubellus salinus]|uniref:bifunctional metallophosphatase/5'-nucleotidase n=1 Tax=Halorubellus salinus TaxID=755309 RepID=UPI001D094D0E